MHQLVTDLLRRALLFHGLSLSCCTILISTTHINNIISSDAAISSKHVCTKHTCLFLKEVS